MIPDWVITCVDTLGAAALAAAFLLVLLRGPWARSPTRWLLAAILAVGVFDGIGNILQWSGLLPEADLAEDFISPVMPILWLFLFVVELERADRLRLRRGYDRMTAVHHLALHLTVTMEPQAIMEEVVEAAGRLLGAPLAVTFSPDPKGKQLVARTWRGLVRGEADALAGDMDSSLGGQAFLDRRPHWTNSPATDLDDAAAAIMQEHGITSIVCVPLLSRGDAVGVLGVGRTGGRIFDHDDVRLLETLCAHAAVAIENARLYERVAESEARYRLLVENTRAALVVLDADRNVIFWNRGAEHLLGWTAREVDGQHIEFIYPEDRRVEAVEHILPVLQRQGAWAGEFPLVRKDGTPFTAFLNLSRISDLQGNVISTLGILTDVTDRVQLREQLLQAQKMETVGALAGGIAHDFNNLLTAILGFASLLQTATPEGSENHEAVASIQQAAERGSRLIRQLTAFSQKQPPSQEPVDLNQVVRETIELTARTFPKTVDVETQFEPHLHTIRGDPTQMHQVLLNLMLNARDAMAEDGTLSITTENLDLSTPDPIADHLTAGPCVALSVSDTGHGIAPEDQPHIFEPFFTTKGQDEGTGLGLSTAYAIAMRHGGRITFTSAFGKGTTFRMVLPAMR